MDFSSLPEASEGLIRAAGGIVRSGHRVLLVHRPRYDDWSLPKGKLETGESWAEGALREVAEETGLHCRLGAFAQAIEYTHQGRSKVVAYYHMTPETDRPFQANDEVDQIAWMPIHEAIGRLVHETEKAVLKGIQQDPWGT